MRFNWRIIILIVVVFVCLSAATSFFLLKEKIDQEVKTKEAIQNRPMIYSYFAYSTGVSLSLTSNDMECMLRIQKYYEDLQKGRESNLPGCFEHGIPLNKRVFLLSLTKDSLYAKVAFFYKRPNGTDRYFTGYVLKRSLHKEPYKRVK